MRVTVLKCDTCNKKHEEILLPVGWFALEQGQEIRDQQSKKHFCSLECLVNWTSLQTVDSRKIDVEELECLASKVVKYVADMSGTLDIAEVIRLSEEARDEANEYWGDL